MIGIGSILENTLAKSNGNRIMVWGSGFIERPGKEICWAKDKLEFDPKAIRNLTFYAVRGRETLKRIPAKYRNIPLGDPGLLTNLAFKQVRKTDKIGIVPHYDNLDDPLLDNIRQDDRFVIINPLDPVKKVVTTISSCKLVISSSLHGLIVADSYGVPCVHTTFKHKLIGGDYKFLDYYSVTGRDYKCIKFLQILDDDFNDQLIADYKPVANLREIQRGLMKSFPYTYENRIRRAKELASKRRKPS